MKTLYHDEAFLEIALENLPALLIKFNKMEMAKKRSLEERIIGNLKNDPVDRACDIALSNKKFKTVVSGVAKVSDFKNERVKELRDQVDQMEHTPGPKSTFGKLFRTILNSL
jgi:hypothetical protein